MNNTIDTVFAQLAEYTRIQEETSAIIDGLKDDIKRYMTEHNTDTVIGKEHKATYKSVSSTRFDSTAFKAQHPDTYNEYTRTVTSTRFVFK